MTLVNGDEGSGNRRRASGWVSRRARRGAVFTAAGVLVAVLIAFYVMLLFAGG